MGQYLQTDLDADREVAEAIAALIFEGQRQPPGSEPLVQRNVARRPDWNAEP